jgi:mannitol/fructose-specific phosphotransferase system IIA component (Ntr-type)
MGEMAVLFSLGLVALTVIWYFRYAHERVERAGAIFHAFARLGERRHGGLDLELRGIVKEKGLREEDPFDEVVARAAVMDVEDPISLDELLGRAARHLAAALGLAGESLLDELMKEMRTGFVPLAPWAALPHLRVPGLEHPELLLIRVRRGLSPASHGRVALHPDPPEELRALLLLVSSEEEPGRHLRLLGHLATHVDDAGFLTRWMHARDDQELRKTLLRAERSLTIRVRRDRATREWIGRAIRDLPLPDDTLVAMIRRNTSGLIPNGSSIIREDDHLVVIGDPGPIAHLADRYGG